MTCPLAWGRTELRRFVPQQTGVETGGIMNCHRCNGLMYGMELRDSKGWERLRAYVCILCGEIVDPVIAVNRTRNVARETLLPKRAPRRRNYWKRCTGLALRAGRHDGVLRS